MSVPITIKNTDKVCVATRLIAIINNEEKRIKTVMEELGYDERTAKRFVWFVKTLSQPGIVCNEAVAAAWVANELFGNDGVNSPEDDFEIALLVKEGKADLDDSTPRGKAIRDLARMIADKGGA